MEGEGFFHSRSSITSELVRKKQSGRPLDKVQVSTLGLSLFKGLTRKSGMWSGPR